MVAGPASLELLRKGAKQPSLPRGYPFPLISYLALEYARLGHEVTVVSTDSTLGGTVEIAGRGVPILLCPRRRRAHADLFRRERSVLSAVIGGLSPDVVHAHWLYEFAAGSLASGAPTVVTSHDAPWRVFSVQRDRVRLARALLSRGVLTRAHYLTAVSPYILGELRSARPSAYRTVIPNAVSDSFFHEDQSDFPAERQVPTPPLPVLGAVSSGWSRLKNGATLLKAFQYLLKQEPGAMLRLFGVGYGQGGPAHELALKLGVAPRIDFCGTVAHEELARRLNVGMDILVQPSLEESFSMVVAEAMALGKPTIVGRDCGAVEWTAGVPTASIAVNMRSPVELAQAMLRMIRLDSSERRAMGRAGNSIAQARYRMSDVAGQYLDVLETAANVSTRRS